MDPRDQSILQFIIDSFPICASKVTEAGAVKKKKERKKEEGTNRKKLMENLPNSLTFI
jgi:hypothetical protein